MNRLGIEFLSAMALPPTALAELAADLGCRSISTMLEPYGEGGTPAWSLKTDAALRRELKAILADRGLVIGLGEGFGARPGVEAADYARDLDIMVELGAERINVLSLEPDQARTFDLYAQVAEMAAKVGLPVVTEFAPCLAITDLPTALAAVRHVGRPDFRLLIDTMHLVRSGGGAADLAALDPDLIGYVQLSDAPLTPTIPTYWEEAAFERLCPGEGELPLADILRAVPQHVVVSLEIPQRAKTLAGASPKALLEPCVRATRRLLEETAT